MMMPAFKRGYQIAAARSRGSFNAASANDALERFMRFARIWATNLTIFGNCASESPAIGDSEA